LPAEKESGGYWQVEPEDGSQTVSVDEAAFSVRAKAILDALRVEP
jgi:hypothetical protein